MDESVSLTIGGDNSALLSTLSESEQKIRQYAQRADSHLNSIGANTRGFENMLEGERRVKNNVSALTQTILSGASASDILSAALVRTGESMKIGLGGAVGLAVFARASEDLSAAIDKVKELREELERLSKPSGGQSNTNFVSAGDIDKRIADIKTFIATNRGTPGVSQGYGDLFTGMGEDTGNALTDIYNAGLPGIGREDWNILGKDMRSNTERGTARSDRELEAQDKLAKEKDRQAEKYHQSIEAASRRGSGDQEGADRDQINATFDEKVGVAADDKNPAMLKELEAARKQALGESAKKYDLDRYSRSNQVALSDAEQRNSAESVGRDDESNQRARLKLSIEEAAGNADVSRNAANATPGDQGLQDKASIDYNKQLQAKSELSAWEDKIAIQKASELKIAQALFESTHDRLEGETDLANLTELEAQNAAKVADLRRQGENKLADQAENLGRLQVVQAITKANPKTGIPEGNDQVTHNQHKQAGVSSKINSALQRNSADDFIGQAHRDRNNQIIEGHDTITNQKVQRDPTTGDIYAIDKDGRRGKKLRGPMTPPPHEKPLRDQLKPDDDFLNQFRRHDSQLHGGTSGSKAEIEGAAHQHSAEQAHKTATAMHAAVTAQAQKSGGPELATLNKIASILQEWNV